MFSKVQHVESVENIENEAILLGRIVHCCKKKAGEVHKY